MIGRVENKFQEVNSEVKILLAAQKSFSDSVKCFNIHK